MADKTTQAVITDPINGDGMKKIMDFKLFGMNIFVLLALLVILGVIGFFAYKFFFAKKQPTVPNKESLPNQNPTKGTQQQGELDQIHAYYQQQLALQEQEYRQHLEQMGDHEVREEDREDDREVEIEDEQSEQSHEEPESVEEKEEEESDDNPRQPFKIEINDVPPQDVKVIRRGKKKGQELTADEYAKKAAKLMAQS